MGKANHTPGPWHRFEEDGHEVIAVATHGETDFREIATAYEGNGAIIEAAPDLLEACKAALAYIPNSVVHSWPPGFELKAKALELLNSAIAKATGQ